MNEAKKSLVLGIGSQYAGTTLLHSILDQCTDIAMHPMTELHYFDTLYGVRDESLLEKYAQNQYDYEYDKFMHEYNQTFFNTRHKTLLLSSKMLANKKVEDIDYFELFEPMKDVSEYIGEISPEYMLIKESDLEKMSDYLGRDCKIILQVRHPIERFLESLKSQIPQEVLDQDKHMSEKDFFGIIQKSPGWFKQQEAFNHYEDALQRYSEYFDNVLVLSYEALQNNPEETLFGLQDFLDLPLDDAKAKELCNGFFAQAEPTIEISPSFRSLLEHKFHENIHYLYDTFPENYDNTVIVPPENIEIISSDIPEKSTLMHLSIKDFDLEAFLEANSDLKDVFTKMNFDEEVSFPKEILEELYLGKRAFHSDYLPFDEVLYNKAFPDIRRMLQDPNSEVDYGFEHFCISGYEEIMNGTRNWLFAKSKEEGRGDASIKVIPFEYLWLTKANLHTDPFYTFLFLDSIDEQKFLASNPDVKKAIDDDSFESLSDYLIYNGIKEIEEGTRFPYGEVPLKQSIMGSVDRAVVIDNNQLFLSGWLFADKQRKITNLYLSNGEEGVDILDSVSRFDRSDLESMMGTGYRTAGFYLYVKSDLFNNEEAREYAVIVVTEDGLSSRIPLTLETITDPKDLSRVLLDPLRIDSKLFENLDHNIGPALQSMVLANPYVIKEEMITVKEYGKIPKKPKVSVVVPLYGRIDFVEYQLSLFVNDPYFFKDVELIYILDDPSLKDAFVRLVQGLYPLFELPFKTITYDENYGYAIVNNIGVRYASAEKVLLLNSDIMPKKNGWLAEMVVAYDSLENPGAVGPKLLFADGSIQHAGMAFEKSEVFSMWLNEHPGKGLPDMVHETEAREVPAVTAACMLMEKSLYGEVGGLSENYLLGDFEDSDLCLKVLEKGRKNYYLPDIALYHLERQSQNLFSDTSWKTKLTLFNGWQHTKKWDTLITKLMGDNQ